METQQQQPNEWKKTLIKCLGLMGTALNRPLDVGIETAFTLVCGHLTEEQLQAATLNCLRTCKFFPSPSEFLENAGEVPAAARAEMAWLAFDGVFKRHGIYKSLDFEDKVINAVIRSLGGLEDIAELPGEEYQRFLRARFLKAYCDLIKTGHAASEFCGPLVGFFDRTNGKLPEESRNLLRISVTGKTRENVAIGESRPAARLNTTLESNNGKR